MIDQENKVFGEEEPLKEPQTEPEQENKAQEVSPADIPAEESSPEKAPEDAAVEDGFSEGGAEAPVEPTKPPLPTEPVEQEIPTVEEPAIPANEEEQPAFEPMVQQETLPQETPQQEIPQGVPPMGGYPAYPQWHQEQQGYPVQNPVPPYGYAPQYQPQPQYQVPYQPQNQPPYPPQNQPPYYGQPQGYQGYPAGYVPQETPQPVVPQPVPYGYPGYGMPSLPPKKKMSVGLKVFIWIASILAAAALLGFGSYLAYNAVNAPTSSNRFNGNFPSNPTTPWSPGDWGNKDEDEIPDFDDGVIPPEIDKGDPVPDVDVTPNTEGITIHPQPEGEELTAQEVYQKVVKSTVTVAVTYSQNGKESHSTGTGIIATSDGYIITNSHVVMNSKSSVVEITAYDGQTYEAVVVGVDLTNDLAILKTNDYNFTPAEFGDSAELTIGDSVLAIGNPGGAKFSGSMTGGYISGLDRSVGSYSENGMTYIQTDAAINPGNSGGPLVNMYGQVVGINSSKIVSDGYEGMGFAIPVSKAQSIINELLSGGYVKGRTRLGITGSDVTSSMAMFYGMPQGFVIYEIAEESAFTGTEAQPGDVIIAIDGETVTGLTDISNLLLKHSPGDKATVTLYRQDGTELDVTITLLEDKGETQK